jgi:hypothetical protein
MYAVIYLDNYSDNDLSYFETFRDVGACSNVVGWRTMLQAGKVMGSKPDEVIWFIQFT